MDKKFELMDFKEHWLNLIGRPELSGSWIIWGGSTSGKTSFAMQLTKYLSNFGHVLYNSLEEGVSESLKLALTRVKMIEASRVKVLDKEPLNELVERLSKPKSARIIIIDSLQYTQLDLQGYVELKQLFPKKLFIYISHADGKEPDGKLAKRIRYDSNVKIFVDGFMASCNSRYGGGKPMVVWQEGAARFWGVSNEQQQ